MDRKYIASVTLWNIVRCACEQKRLDYPTAMYLMDKISETPAADVAPVRHARWTAEDRCSACGEEPLTDFDVTLMRFCPYCGAKMDGGDTNG